MSNQNKSAGFACKSFISVCGLLVIAALVLWLFQAQLSQWWPFAIILLCPLMHLLMHRRHHRHSDKDSETEYRRGYEAGLHENSDTNTTADAADSKATEGGKDV